MGFLNVAGKMLGHMAAKAQELNSLKSEYAYMNNDELKREYKALAGKSNSDSSNRKAAITLILKDRGIIQDSND